MNFFFGIKTSILNSEIKIPKFQNNGFKGKNYFVYGAIPKENKWSITKVECEFDENFFYVNFSNFNEKQIFFLAKDVEIDNYLNKNLNNLISLNNFTNTSPIEFRSNLFVYINNKGFSSYQSEYPFNMSKKKGSIFSPLGTLLDSSAEKNILFFKNIYFEPTIEKSKLYIVDIKKKKIIEKLDIFTNTTNEINIKKEYIINNFYIFTDKILGIPLFLSIKNNHISFEHTHPPHLYLINQNRFGKIAELKQEIRNFIDYESKINVFK